jgi:hypothetical protein
MRSGDADQVAATSSALHLRVSFAVRHQRVERDRASLFSLITGNWRGRPFVSHQVVVQLIAATTTKTGLKVRRELDQTTYPAGIKSGNSRTGPEHLISWKTGENRAHERA